VTSNFTGIVYLVGPCFLVLTYHENGEQKPLPKSLLSLANAHPSMMHYPPGMAVILNVEETVIPAICGLLGLEATEYVKTEDYGH